VLEVTSRRTRREDQETKPVTYAHLGVQEYWQYDPTGDYLRPALQGFRLVAGRYEPLPGIEEPAAGRRLHSAVLGLDLALEQGRLRFIDPVTGRPLWTHEEAELAWQAAEAARQQAEARQAELQAQLQALRAAGAAGPEPPRETRP
jgi:hypothetical protein